MSKGTEHFEKMFLESTHPCAGFLSVTRIEYLSLDKVFSFSLCIFQQRYFLKSTSSLHGVRPLSTSASFVVQILSNDQNFQKVYGATNN